jgi:tripeptidyl-peptidase-1
LLTSNSSHPDSPNYGKYWSSEDVHNAFAPLDESVEAVREWLTGFGIHGSRIVHSDNKGWLAFDATADEAERLLRTEYFEHEHVYSSKMRVGCDEYDFPLSFRNSG